MTLASFGLRCAYIYVFIVEPITLICHFLFVFYQFAGTLIISPGSLCLLYYRW